MSLLAVRIKKDTRRWRASRARLRTSHRHLGHQRAVSLRRGLSLTEILISMGVMIIGLLSVAAVFPVGGTYMSLGDTYDNASTTGQAAFSDLVTRGWLNPLNWRYANGRVGNGTQLFGFVDYSAFTQRRPTAFVIDPIGAAAFMEERVNPNAGITFPAGGGPAWPVRRITFADTILNGNGTVGVDPTSAWMPSSVAAALFHARDDLVIEIPDAGDRPAQQSWERLNSGVNSLPLARNWKGDFSWMATISPTTVDAAHALIAPAGDAGGQIPPNSYGRHSYDVSVAVFRKRDLSDMQASERVVRCRIVSEGQNGGAVQFEQMPGQPLGRTLEAIRPGNWIALISSNTNDIAPGTPTVAGRLAHGVHSTVGVLGDLPRVIWYRLVDIDNISRDGVHLPAENQFGGGAFVRASLSGPDWPWPAGGTVVVPAAIVPGIVAVYTRTQRLEAPTLWSP